MKGHHVLIIVLSVIMLMTVSFPANAQYTADRLFNYLQETYNRHDSKLFDFMVAELNQFVQTFPDSARAADASYLLARLYDEKGKEREALVTAYKTFYLYPNSSLREESAALVQGIFTKEKVYQDKQERLLAILNVAPAGGTAADRYESYLTFLKELDDSNLYDWTLKEARYFATKFPSDSSLYNVLQWIADLYAKGDKPREAVVSYLKLESLYPDNPLLPYARYSRAKLLYEKLDDYQTAIDVCNQVVSAYPSSEYASASLFMLGEMKEKKIKDYEGAIAAYRKLVDTYPQYVKSINALLAIGELNAKKLKNYPVAIMAYSEFIEKYKSSPRAVEALEAIGNIYYDNLKDYIKAAEYYAKISDLYPTYEKAPDMLMKAGSICEDKLADYQKAIEYYQLVVDKYSDSKKAGDAAKKIAKAKEKIGK